MLTTRAPPPTEQRYLGIRDLVMSFEIPVVPSAFEFPVWESLALDLLMRVMGDGSDFRTFTEKFSVCRPSECIL
jgi:hypothetical protein